jgi:hypothetical protein
LAYTFRTMMSSSGDESPQFDSEELPRLRREIQLLKSEKRKWEDKEQTLIEELTKKRRKGVVKRGKNAVNLDSLHKSGYAEDAPNYGAISVLVSNKIFRQHKFLVKHWDVYSENPRTVCGLTGNVVVYPAECNDEPEEKKKYWENHLVPMINKKFSTLKGNATQNMRRLFMGKGNYCIEFMYSLHTKNNIYTIDLYNYFTQRIQGRLTIHLLTRWVKFIGEGQMINRIFP